MNVCGTKDGGHRNEPENCLERRIREVFHNRNVRRIPWTSDLTRAAVLIPLLKRDGAYHVLFTRRSDTVRHHKGEISFPGGAHDRTDRDLLSTALREAEEEIGVKAEDVEVLGCLDEVVTMSDFLVSPYVGMIPYPYAFMISPEEIAELIILPLRCFFKYNAAEDYRTYGQKTGKVYVYECGEYVVWGATAKILSGLVDLLCRDGAIR